MAGRKPKPTALKKLEGNPGKRKLNTKEPVPGKGIPFAYDHFAEGESPEPPFICFLFPGSENFSADNIVYAEFSNLSIELYTDEKDPELEDSIEAVLNDHELFWNKSEVWIESEKLYEVLYQMTV